MSVQLVVRDGDPYWYLSPDIWVVPGSDPNGPPGVPIAGRPAYLWAHLRNLGDTGANGVRLDFYWANPALQVLRSTATMIGSAFADVPAGGGQDTLCLVPWTPAVVNEGHECLVVVANHPDDQLPDPLPDAFDPPGFRQVAQRNLTVLVASANASRRLLTVGAERREDKAVTVAAEIGGHLDKTSLVRLGINDLRPARGNAVEVGLDLRPQMEDRPKPGPARIDVQVKRGTSMAVYASVRATSLAKGEYQLVTVTERRDGRILGGIGFIVLADEREARS